MNGIRSFMLAALLAVMFSSCDGGSGKTAALLDEVEGYMQQSPDSALSVLTAIPQESLRSDRLRARWSLLYAMALHKSYAVLFSEVRKSIVNRLMFNYGFGSRCTSN